MDITQCNTKITSLNIEKQQKKIKSNRLASIRLFLFVLFVVCMYYGYQRASYVYYFGIGFFLLFLWFANRHRIIKRDIEMVDVTIHSYEDIVKRRGEEWKAFPDQGDDFLITQATQAYDLDIFGTASLYQYLCCAKTVLGREELARLLTCVKQEKSDVELRQQATKELYDKVDFSITLVALLKLFEQHARKKKKQTMDDFFAYMEQEGNSKSVFLHCIVTSVSIGTMICLLWTLYTHGSILYFAVLGVMSLSVAMLSVIKNAQSFHDVNVIEHTLSDYGNIFECISKQSFQSAYLMDSSDVLQDAANALRALNRIVNMIRLRNDGISFIILNLLFLIDFQCVFALEAWKRTYGKQVRLWFGALARMESIVSLTQLSYAKDTLTYPIMEDMQTPFLSTTSLRHPLIREVQAVANDFDAEAKTYIVTGSNMSGKTTFLRTIGLNMVLFHAGAMVCGASFRATSMNVFTSMRIKDDVSEGISTFYAEILRIKEMIVESEKQQPLLVLIDEIFKGTNSADRIICAKEVLYQLHLPHVLTMVSTHDFELCEQCFHDDTSAVNFHFDEYYEDDEIHFEYTLKKGRCMTTNAKELLKMAGIEMASK